MKCTSCGFNNDDSNKFCSNCGSELTSSFDEASVEENICANCGAENQAGNKYCISCGSELTSSFDEASVEENICTNCGAENQAGNKFCISCGAKLEPGVSAHQANAKDFRARPGDLRNKKNKRREVHTANFQAGKNIKRTNNPPTKLKYLWVSVGVIISAIIIAISFDLITNKKPVVNNEPVELKSSNPVIEAQVTAIASKFICSCGTKECANQSLETCTCGIAIEERQFIRSRLENKDKPDNIVVANANQYGFLKEQFTSQYKVDPSKVWRSNQIGLKNYLNK